MTKAGVPAIPVRVRDVMTEAVMFLNASHTQEEAWQLLHTHGVGGAPVLGNGNLVGVVTRSDLGDPRRGGRRGTVADAMTRVVYAVRATDPAMAAVRLMLDENIHRAVVLNEDGTIAGIVTPMDILRALTRGIDIRDSSVAECDVEYVDLRKLRTGTASRVRTDD
jgi:CBS domain-containing protein